MPILIFLIRSSQIYQSGSYKLPPYNTSRIMQLQSQTQTQSLAKDPYFSMFAAQPQQMLIRSISRELDDFLEGGLHRGCITQIYGEAGCGKTQIAMLFALGAISRGMPVCFLSTEKELSWSRFTSLAYNFMNQAEFEENEKQLMYRRSSDFNQGYEFIQECMKTIKEGGRGGVLIIDSVHSFVNSCLEFHNIENEVFQKSKKQAEIVNRIRWLAKMAGAAVLLTNHAADVIDKRRGSSGRSIVPTLGQAWELNIDENLYLTRKGEIRELSIVHSPKCPRNSKKRFRLETAGFCWISEDGVEFVG